MAMLSLAVFACGQPQGEEDASPGNGPTPEQAMRESSDPATIRTLPTQEQVASEMAGHNWSDQGSSAGEVEPLWCRLEVVEPCPAVGYGTCAVRCCDDYLDKSFQVCGNCGAWATGVCASHGTRKRIRWE
ncbi:hypothetical protein NVS55_23320 [Myxococcus stipitatus]|uniref:hypothetical protein n=1 Tax=Myxococcus stipitatus TaxID=83455 RepID=UPI00314566EC